MSGGIFQKIPFSVLKTKIAFLLSAIEILGVSIVSANELDNLYGEPSQPSHVKYYEVDANDKVMLNPYLQVSTQKNKAILDPSKPVYNWVIDIQGNIRIGEPAVHPRGRRYTTCFTRPEDGYRNKNDYVEKYGHVSASAGAPARISGEIFNDRNNKRWIINNKSGRYSRRINDRTPDKLMNAAALIHAQVDPGGQEWGATIYLLDYGPEQVKAEARGSENILYAVPEENKLPYIVL